MKDKIIECVPNFSEGTDRSVIEKIAAAIERVETARILHMTSDAWHNRSVITFAASREKMEDAAFAAISTACDLIDLTLHKGVHPRMGAADVVPFIPIQNTTIDDCIRIAENVGRRVGESLQIPVYLYEFAASNPGNRNLANVRRGGFEAIQRDILIPGKRDPDFGPSVIHPTAGASAIGARNFLMAYNIYIGDSSLIETAKEVARRVRESNGGLVGLKALGLEVNGQAQVSMNIVDVQTLSLRTVYDAIANELERIGGAEITWSEIIGLVPERMNFSGATDYLRLRVSIEDHLLEPALRSNGFAL